MLQIRSLLNTVKVIHYSRVNYKNDLTEEQKRRLNICKTCPYNSDNKKQYTIKQKIFIFLNKIVNKIYGLNVLVDAVCTVCGCGIVFMSTQEDEEQKCKLKKW